MMINIFLGTTNFISFNYSFCCECLLNVITENKVDAD